MHFDTLPWTDTIYVFCCELESDLGQICQEIIRPEKGFWDDAICRVFQWWPWLGPSLISVTCCSANKWLLIIEAIRGSQRHVKDRSRSEHPSGICKSNSTPQFRNNYSAPNGLFILFNCLRQPHEAARVAQRALWSLCLGMLRALQIAHRIL